MSYAQPAFSTPDQLSIGLGAAPSRSRLGKLPVATVGPFAGAKDTLRLMAQMAVGDDGERSMLVRHFTTWVVGSIWPKDYNGEILAIRNMLVQPSPFIVDEKGQPVGTPLIRYTNDPRHVEAVKTPRRMVEEIFEHGTTAVDCDESACLAGTMALQVGREVAFVAMGFEPGHLTHVGVKVREPKSNRWVWLDGVAGPKEKQAASRAKELLVWSLD